MVRPAARYDGMLAGTPDRTLAAMQALATAIAGARITVTQVLHAAATRSASTPFCSSRQAGVKICRRLRCWMVMGEGFSMLPLNQD